MIITQAYSALISFPYRLDQSTRVKVADFGLARDIYTDSYYTSANRRKPLPIKWLAPESLLDRIFTEKTDVVSI